MTRFHWLPLVLLVVLVTASPRAAWSNSPPPSPAAGSESGDSKRDERFRKLSEKLQALRARQTTKPQILADMRERLQRRNSPDVDQKIQSIGLILDRVLVMSEKDYASRHPAIVKEIMGISGKGMPKDH